MLDFIGILKLINIHGLDGYFIDWSEVLIIKGIMKKLLRIIGIIDSLAIIVFAVLFFTGIHNFIKLLPIMLGVLCIVTFLSKKMK